MFSTPSFMYRWNAFQLQGRRARQEDDVRAERLFGFPSLWFFAVADGLGGHAHGDWASRTAVHTMREHFKQTLDRAPSPMLPCDDDWHAGLRVAHQQVIDLAAYGASRRNLPASTLTAAVADEDGCMSLASIGDCSVWHLHGEQTKLLFAPQGDGGWMQFAVGIEILDGLAAQTRQLQLAHRDRLVFATDGIETLSPALLDALFRLPLDQAVGELILAIRAAGHPEQDNVTVLIVEAIQPDRPDDAS